MNFIEELQWRGMIHTMMPGTEEQLAKVQYALDQVALYISEMQEELTKIATTSPVRKLEE